MGCAWQRQLPRPCLIVLAWLGWSVSLLPAQEPLATLKAHAGQVCAMVFSHDGKRLFSGGADGTVKLWDVATRKIVKTFPSHRRGVCSVALSPDGKTLAVGALDPGSRDVKVTLVPFKLETIRETPTNAEITLWDLAAGTEKVVVQVGSHTPWPLAFSRDGSSLISGGGPAVTPGGTGQAVKIWDVKSRRETASHKGPPGEENWVALTADGKCVAWGCPDGNVRVHNLVSGKQWTVQHAPPVVFVAFSADGKLLASARDDVKLWDATTAKELAVLPSHRKGMGTYTLAFAPNSKILAAGSGLNKPGQKCYGGVVRIWDVRTGKLLAHLEGHKDSVQCFAFTSDGTVLASGSIDGTIALWRMPSPKAAEDSKTPAKK